MSITITAMALPSVASGPWERAEARLRETGSDWETLRTGLIHLLCDRLGKEGTPVSRVEEYLLGTLYAASPHRASFREALSLVRRETQEWPPAALELVERALAAQPRFPSGSAGQGVALDDLRAAALQAGTPVPPIQRSLDRFRTPDESSPWHVGLAARVCCPCGTAAGSVRKGCTR